MWRHVGKTVFNSLVCWFALLLSVLCTMGSAWAADYMAHIMPGGKLQRFHDSATVVYYKLDALENLPGWDYTQLDFSKDQLVHDAFSEWSNALGGRVVFKQTAQPALADITVHWRKSFNQKDLLGVERPSYAQNGYIVDADIEITLMSGGKVLPHDTLKAIALHEVGHALGMAGHSPNTGDMMYWAIQPGVSRLSANDIATIRRMYQTPAQVTTPPGTHLGGYKASIQLFQKAYTAYQKKQFSTAYTGFAQAAKLNPAMPQLAIMAGLTAYQLQAYDKAISHLKGLKQLPANYQGPVQLALGDAYLQQGLKAQKQGQAANASAYFKQATPYLKGVLQSQTTAQDKQQAQAKLAWLGAQGG